MSKFFFPSAFVAGLAVVLWIGLGYVGSNWLPLVVTTAILGTYLLGAAELRRFRADTAGLHAALPNAGTPPESLAAWLDRVPATLRAAVRTRIEHERGALPGPALTPYLVGLLVMLGMLGTFLGMVVTFRGAVFALEGSTELQAIRAALAEPVRGLALSFGTSVAGVAASAMLGLMSAIARRERLETSRALEGALAGALQPYTLAHQRQTAFAALQQQTHALPQVVDGLNALMERIEARSRELDEKLLQQHAQFQSEAKLAYTGLAERVGGALQDSLAAGARAASDAIQPVVERTMAGLAQESRTLQQAVAQTFEQRSADVLAAVNDSLARAQSEQLAWEQRRLQAWTQDLQAVATELQTQWRQVAQQASAQHAGTLERVSALLDASQALTQSRSEAEAQWTQQQRERMDELASLWRSELAALREDEGRRGQAAVDRLEELRAVLAQHLASLREQENERGHAVVEQFKELHAAVTQQLAALRENESTRGQAAVDRLDELRAALAQHLASLRDEESARGQAVIEQFKELHASVARDLAALRQDESTRGQAAVERLDELRGAVTQHLVSLREDESARGQAAVERLGELQAAVAQHLATLGAALEAPITRLLQTASEVPQAAAGVIEQLRAEMSRAAERDNAALQERTELMAQLAALMQSVNQAAGEQRSATEALLASATTVLQQAGERFGATLDAQADKAAETATHLAASAVELSALGEAFAQGVQGFQASNEQLVATLQRIETSLEKSTARSDEQLAYYVAQAREVIDLSIASQQGLVESLRELKRPARPNADTPAEVADAIAP